MIKGVRIGGMGTALSFLDTLVIPIIENTPNEEDLKDSMAAAMAEYPEAAGVLVRRHGVYVWGADWEKAKTQTEVHFYTASEWGCVLMIIVFGLSLRDQCEDEASWPSNRVIIVPIEYHVVRSCYTLLLVTSCARVECVKSVKEGANQLSQGRRLRRGDRSPYTFRSGRLECPNLTARIRGDGDCRPAFVHQQRVVRHIKITSSAPSLLNRLSSR
jgi:hypothetical protein